MESARNQGYRGVVEAVGRERWGMEKRNGE
jgi:hypothetical protein